MTARTPITAEERERLRKLCEAATPGPWHAAKDGEHFYALFTEDHEYAFGCRDDYDEEANAELAVAAVNALSCLLDDVDEMDAHIGTMQCVVEEARVEHNAMRDELAALRQQNARLVEALRAYMDHDEHMTSVDSELVTRARAALADPKE
jgi:hypothetical protein